MIRTIPLGRFTPDAKLFRQDGLTKCYGVTPISGHYMGVPSYYCPWTAAGSPVSLAKPTDGSGDPTRIPLGFELHQTFDAGVRRLWGYYGTRNRLFEIDITDQAFEVDRSRAGSPPYDFIGDPPLSTELWWFTTFGQNVVATNFSNPVQILTDPGSGAFEDMITSTFKPSARFAFSIRDQLFLAYLFVPSDYDTLTAGTHQQAVAWSQVGNIRAFGGENLDPQLTGAGFQAVVGGDVGPITAVAGGDFGLLFCARGIVRIDGPPYEFRTIVTGDTTMYPYSIIKVGSDVYFWGRGGPSVLENGEPPVRRLGEGTIARSLLDTETGFGADFALGTDAVEDRRGVRRLSGGADVTNGLLRWSYLPVDEATVSEDRMLFGTYPATLTLDYNIREERFTVSRSGEVDEGSNRIPRDWFLRTSFASEGDQWGPYSTVYGLQEGLRDSIGGAPDPWYLFRYQVSGGFGAMPDLEFQTGLGTLDEVSQTRIRRVRSVWSATSGFGDTIAEQMEIYVVTRRSPWENDVVTGPFTVIGDDGWIGTLDSVFGSYHQVIFVFRSHPDLDEIQEIEALEVDVEVGGQFSS